MKIAFSLCTLLTIFLAPTPQFQPRVQISALYIVHDDQILLLHRQDGKPQGNKWGIPGGKVEKGETPLQAVVREVQEETGFEFAPEELEILPTVYIEYDEKDHFVYHMFRTKLKGDPGTVKIDFKAHKGFTWVTPAEALKMDLLKDEDPCIRLVYPEGA